MKYRKSIFYWTGISLACLVALLAGYVWGQNSIEGRFSNGEAAEIFRALLKYDGKISKNNCEKEISEVSDFVSSYLDRSFFIENSNYRSLACNGAPLLQCSWRFGRDSPSEAWGRILDFQYDTASKKIVSGSVSCLDVP